MKHLLTILILCLLTFSCKKTGCTDVTAVNYDPEAEIGNNSCVFEGKIQFVMKNGNYADLGFDTVYVYVDNNYLGKQATTEVWLEPVNCSTELPLVYKEEMGDVVSKPIQYRIQTIDSFIINEQSMNLIRSRCQEVPLY